MIFNLVPRLQLVWLGLLLIVIWLCTFLYSSTSFQTVLTPFISPASSDESTVATFATTAHTVEEVGAGSNTASQIPSERPLISYAYYETDFGRRNLQFFVDHGLHNAADFVFIINGESDADQSIIFNQTGKQYHDQSNIKVIKRNNTCFDLGSHAEVLSNLVGGEGWLDQDGPIDAPDDSTDDDTAFLPLKDKYKRFILMNASIRGPFVPLWSNQCWSDAYLRKLTSRIKLVGMAYNCLGGRAGHVQSMIWATDSIGLAHILTPAGISECFATLRRAMMAEIRTTRVLRDAGYEVDVFMTVYHSKDKETREQLLGEQLEVPGDWRVNCTDRDYLGHNNYFGTIVHPYENLFMKSHRHIDDNLMDHLTDWHDGMGYESYDVCH